MEPRIVKILGETFPAPLPGVTATPDEWNKKWSWTLQTGRYNALEICVDESNITLDITERAKKCEMVLLLIDEDGNVIFDADRYTYRWPVPYDAGYQRITGFSVGVDVLGIEKVAELDYSEKQSLAKYLSEQIQQHKCDVQVEETPSWEYQLVLVRSQAERTKNDVESAAKFLRSLGLTVQKTGTSLVVDGLLKNIVGIRTKLREEYKKQSNYKQARTLLNPPITPKPRIAKVLYSPYTVSDNGGTAHDDWIQKFSKQLRLGGYNAVEFDVYNSNEPEDTDALTSPELLAKGLFLINKDGKVLAGTSYIHIEKFSVGVDVLDITEIGQLDHSEMNHLAQYLSRQLVTYKCEVIVEQPPWSNTQFHLVRKEDSTEEQDVERAAWVLDGLGLSVHRQRDTEYLVVNGNLEDIADIRTKLRREHKKKSNYNLVQELLQNGYLHERDVLTQHRKRLDLLCQAVQWKFTLSEVKGLLTRRSIPFDKRAIKTNLCTLVSESAAATVEADVWEELKDPVSLTLMLDPVQLASGHCVDLRTWRKLKKEGGLNPFTQTLEVYGTEEPVVNINVQNTVRRFLSDYTNPSYLHYKFVQTAIARLKAQLKEITEQKSSAR